MREAFSLYRPRDGHPDWDRLASEARALAETLLPSLERPRRGPAERRRRLRSHLTALGNFLRNRRIDRAGREDLRPLYFIWTVQRACNFRCTYCDDHRGRKYPDLPDDGTLTTAQGLQLLRTMRTGTPSVYFAGGEPTMRPDLPVLTRHARDLDYYPIIVNTNGSALDRLLARPAWRTWLADTDVIVVSLDGLDLASLAGMWAYRRPERVLRNLLLLRELAPIMRFKLMVNTVIQPGAVAHARDVLDFVNDLGIWFCPVPMNTGPTVAAGLAADPEYAALTDLILVRKCAGYRITGSLRMNQRLLASAPLQCRNTLKPHVDHDGALQWPCKASVHVEPERVDVLAYQDLDALYAAAVERVEPTGFCGPGPNQCGARCNWAQNYTTDAYLHGLRHPRSLLAEVTGFLGDRG
jgi:MoaA/NifB/PqqE/SkfB family radical SAM enzyme